MVHLRRSRLSLRASLAHVVAGAFLALVACQTTPRCPPRDRAEIVETIDPSTAPRPAALALAEAWAADAGVDRSIAPRIAVAITDHATSFPFWELLLRVAPAYTEVADALAARGLPVELAAVPLGLSRYDTDAAEADCRSGPWLLAPIDPGVRLSNCRLKGAPATWSPPEPPEGGLVADGVCRIAGCDVDERSDLAVSTSAAIANIDARWRALPAGGDRLERVLAEVSGEDPALVLARHVLAACFYAEADASWGARWKPARVWCAEALPYRVREVAACAGIPDPTPTH